MTEDTSFLKGVTKMVGRGLLLLGATLVSTSGQPAWSAEVHHQTDYTISLAGLPIARASFVTDMNDKRYTISGTIHSAGIANILTTVSAQTTVNGVINATRLQAKDYELIYTSGKKTKVYTVGFRDGDVSTTTIKPEPYRNPSSWIAVTADDLKSVLDPISGMVFPGDQQVCPRTLPIYDGESRMDLVLAAKGTKKFSIDGFSGDAVVCSLRYAPKSGFKKNRKDIDYLRKMNMEIWFAKSGTIDLYAPVYVRIPTQYGQVTISAVKFGT